MKRRADDYTETQAMILQEAHQRAARKFEAEMTNRLLDFLALAAALPPKP